MWDGLLQAYNLNQVNLATALGVLGLTVKQGRLVLSHVFQCLFDYHCEPWQVSVPVSPCGSPVQPAELCGFPTSLPWAQIDMTDTAKPKETSGSEDRPTCLLLSSETRKCLKIAAEDLHTSMSSVVENLCSTFLQPKKKD